MALTTRLMKCPNILSTTIILLLIKMLFLSTFGCPGFQIEILKHTFPVFMKLKVIENRFSYSQNSNFTVKSVFSVVVYILVM